VGGCFGVTDAVLAADQGEALDQFSKG